ncbi:MAG: glycosyltransferase family 9 protein [Acidobacteriota bacterium]
MHGKGAGIVCNDAPLPGTEKDPDQIRMDLAEPLIERALSSDGGEARAGTRALFSQIIEPLGDSFLRKDMGLQRRVLARAMSRLRQIPRGRPFDLRLGQMGLRNEGDLLRRVSRLEKRKRFDPGTGGPVERILVLSRVTLGADILLTSPIIATMKATFPEAEIVFVGEEKNGLLLKDGTSRVRVRSVRYPRRGALLHRFLTWLDVSKTVERETRGLPGGARCVVVNPDSRFLQSGLLPLLTPREEAGSYFYWHPSIHDGIEGRMSQAASLCRWLQQSFGREGEEGRIHPALHLPAEDVAFADEVFRVFGLELCPYRVSMNLGVGGNPEKRIRSLSETVSRFEKNLVLRLLLDGVTLLLDKGAGEQESRQSDQLALAAREKGFEVVEVDSEAQRWRGIGPRPAQPLGPEPRLVTFKASIGKLGAMIQKSDLYIGYDSFGQHLAAALGRDVLSVFAGYSSTTFPLAWTPSGQGVIRLVKAGRGPFAPDRHEKLVDEVFDQYQVLRRKG